ncbi:MAG: MotA/TolQ/ExbB proton channel family protein [Planctomycetota bacterium]
MRHWLKLTLAGVVIAMVAGLLWGGVVYAQDPAPAAAPAGGAAAATTTSGTGHKKMGLIDDIKAGGIVGACIILLSVAGLALAIENFVTLKVETFIPQPLLLEYEELLDAQNYDEALTIGESDDCMLARVLTAGLLKRERGFASMELAINDAVNYEVEKLQRKIALIAFIANIGPMLGLFGTVTGMLAAFNVIATVENPVPADLAYGIAQALVTTVEGLCVGIPMGTCYFFLRNRVARIANEIYLVSSDFLDRFRT